MSFFKSCGYLEDLELIENFLNLHFKNRSHDLKKYSPDLLESMKYSLFGKGKRFRPVLCVQAARAFGVHPVLSLPLAGALEIVHTYSLIHDDLPCMDDDSERRGQPTNHVKYGEPLALLSGDGLLTEAFLVLSKDTSTDSINTLKLVRLLSLASGPSGMVGGQVMDMGLGIEIKTLDHLKLMQRGKTAVLISAAIEGAGILANKTAEECNLLKEMGCGLGISFQIKDDLLDVDEEEGNKSYVGFLGQEGAERELDRLSENCRQLSRKIPQIETVINQFITVNLERQK